MSCERYAGAIVDYACGADLAADAAAHLHGCGACREMLVEQRQLIAGLDAEIRQTLDIEPSSRFASDVMDRVERRPRAWQSRAWWGLPVAAAAAALLLVALGSQRSAERPVVDRSEAAALQPPSAAPAPAPVPTVPRPQPDSAKPVAGSRLAHQPHASTGSPRAVNAHGPARSEALEVLVPADQPVMVARYLALVRGGAVQSPGPVTDQRAEIPAPDELVVAPLSLEAVVLAGVERENAAAVELRGVK